MEESEEQEDDIDGYGNTTLEYQTNEDMDVDKLLQYVRKYSLEDESIKVWINASSGNSMYFAFNEFENVRFARIGEGVVKKFQSKKALRNFVWCFCQNEQILAKNKRLELILASGFDSAAKLQSRQVSVEDNLADILMKSDYSGLFKKHLSVLCENNIALIEYDLPAREDLTWVKEYKYATASNTIKETPMAPISSMRPCFPTVTIIGLRRYANSQDSRLRFASIGIIIVMLYFLKWSNCCRITGH